MVRRVLLATLGLMLLITACGGTSDSEPTGDTVEFSKEEIPTGLAQVALLTCNQLGGATAEGAVPVITSALTRTATAGFTAQDFGAALRATCPDVMGPLEEDAAVSGLLGS